MAQSRIIYGVHAVLAALTHHPENVLTLYCQDKTDPHRIANILQTAQAAALTIQPMSREKLDKLTQSKHHQGVAAQVRQQSTYDEEAVLSWLATATRPLLLILEGVQDPHNLGACLRSAEALGVDWVILPKVHTAPLNATVSKVACGADQSLPIAMVSNLARFLKQLQQQGVWIIGTALSANKMLDEVDYTGPIAIVMGAEDTGLKRLTQEHCDELVKIPLSGTVESLNVSVATGICLYEIIRQRKHGKC